MLLKQLQSSMELAQNMLGDVPSLNMYDRRVSRAPPQCTTALRLRVTSFPNISDAFEEMPPEMAGLIPDEWRWYYAFADDYLLMAVGNQELIKMNLDHKAGASNCT